MEIPHAPTAVLEGLKRFDPRVSVHFNADMRVWEVREFLTISGIWSHCYYWADGDWRRPTFRPLPGTAEPLIAKLAAQDCAKYGQSGKRMMDAFKRRSGNQRAKMIEKSKETMKERLLEYAKYMQKHWARWRRQYAAGGGSRERAIKERMSLYNDVAKGD